MDSSCRKSCKNFIKHQTLKLPFSTTNALTSGSYLLVNSNVPDSVTHEQMRETTQNAQKKEIANQCSLCFRYCTPDYLSDFPNKSIRSSEFCRGQLWKIPMTELATNIMKFWRLLFSASQDCRKLCPEGRSRCLPQVLLLSSENKIKGSETIVKFSASFTVRDGCNFKQTIADSNRNASCLVIDCLDSLKFIPMQFFLLCKIEICISTSYISFWTLVYLLNHRG